MYGEGTAKCAGWDGMILSLRLFNGGISYFVGSDDNDDDEEGAEAVVDVAVPTPSPEALPWTEEVDVTTIEASSMPSYKWTRTT